MRRAILRLVTCCCFVASVAAQARVAEARIDVVRTGVATLKGVRMRLAWDAGAPAGDLVLSASTLEAPDLGYRFANLQWRCQLQRIARGWRCAGALRGPGAATSQLSLSFDDAHTDAAVVHGRTRIALSRRASTPDLTRIDLARVPAAWAQALVSRAWSTGRLGKGEFDAELAVTARAASPLNIAGPLRIRGLSFDTPDGSLAGENLGLDANLALSLGQDDGALIDGRVRGGELLFGQAYIALAQRDVRLRIEAAQRGASGWQVPAFLWSDGAILHAEGRAAFAPGGALDRLDVQARSDTLGPLRDGYLSGWLGAAGLADLELAGQATAELGLRQGELTNARLALTDARASDPKGRFAFEGVDGDVAYSANAPVSSELRWQGGRLYGLPFAAGSLPLASRDGVLSAQRRVTLPLLGGAAHFDSLRIRPPAAGQGADLQFGLSLETLDVAQLAKAMGWPAFTGQLSGTIPNAHYADDRLVFDGGLDMQLFGGRIGVGALAMERPFGVAPTLSADVELDDLDLEALTGVFGFGSITGKLDGRIAALRLVDWQPVAFDAHLATDRKAGVRQRISQRAVQDLSSVGDASLMSGLQARLIGFFDDFGYSRIGISCRLADEVCAMDGLGSAGNGFIIVEGAGLPRLTVVGFNRRVDWPTLVERLAAVGKGDVKPVVQ